MILSANVLDLSETPYRRLEQQPLSLAFAGFVPGDLSLVTRAMIPTETHNSSQVCQLFQVGSSTTRYDGCIRYDTIRYNRILPMIY